MANSYVQYTADGSTQTFTVTFPYINTDHVEAYVNNVEDTAFTWPTSSTITLSAMPAASAIVLIKRVTPRTVRLVNFEPGTTVSEDNLDTSSQQNFFTMQEILESLEGLIELDVGDDAFDAISKNIKNVLDPTDAQHAATKNYIDVNFVSDLAAAVTAAELAETNAETAQTAAELAETNAETAQTAAELAETNAETAQAAAEAAADTAAIPGAVMAIACDSVPTGFLKCDGASLLRATYADLFTAIGTVFGTADATHFNLPDLRGEFIRGWDNGAGTDPDAASRTDSGDGSTTGDNVGTKQNYDVDPSDLRISCNSAGTAGSSLSKSTYSTTPLYFNSISLATGGNETRPRNVNMMYVIRY